jgi:NhaA family Na+:H+ antiporter
MSERLRRPDRVAPGVLESRSSPGVVLAVLFANVAPEAYAAFVHWSPLGHGSHLNVHFLVNDIFMALFFGIAAKEITESCLPGGALNPPRKAINPLLGTIGGVLGPIGVYFAWVALSGDASIAKGLGHPRRPPTSRWRGWSRGRSSARSTRLVSFLLLLAGRR